MQKYWIWFPGDFEIHQGMLQNFTREERGMQWPAYWYLDDCYRNIKFERTYQLTTLTTFTVHTYQQGYITINEHKYRLNQPITLSPGKQQIVVYVFSPNQLPTIFIDGPVIFSDRNWLADNYLYRRPVGYSNLFTSKSDDPAKIPYVHHPLKPVSMKGQNQGTVIDFGHEINASLHFHGLSKPVTICYGESVAEALDAKMCYYHQSQVTDDSTISKRAFRYIFIPNYDSLNLKVTADCISLPITNHSHFKSSDHLINQIWDASIKTFQLCSDLFYIDGIKRDRWIWGGDAYQDNFINQYSFFNEDIDKRTIIALRGHDTVKQHINTIVDYSLLWIISIDNHYQMSGDREFFEMIMPRMEKMMAYLLAQTNDLGFIYERPGDWIFVDWSEMDKEGTVAAEQMFLLRALQAMITAKQTLNQSAKQYERLYSHLKTNILKYFWDDQQGAFIDSYESGKHHVTRHANILAILFNIVDKDRQLLILKNVLLNDQITQLTTPYFKFFEQDALCKLGHLDHVYQAIRNYWGAMIKAGATTIWEEYDPNISGKQQYAMYGDPFGKSLCHAWGASPVYLLGCYFFGLAPLTPGYKTFQIKPHLTMFKKLDCILPIKNGIVHFQLHNNRIKISSNRNGGTIIAKGQHINLIPHSTVEIDNQ